MPAQGLCRSGTRYEMAIDVAINGADAGEMERSIRMLQLPAEVDLFRRPEKSQLFTHIDHLRRIRAIARCGERGATHPGKEIGTPGMIAEGIEAGLSGFAGAIALDFSGNGRRSPVKFPGDRANRPAGIQQLV